MKVDTEGRSSRSDEAILLEKAGAVLALFDPEKDPQIRSLTRILHAHTPLSYLRQASAEQIVDWIRDIFRLVEERQQDVAIVLLPTEEQGRFLLVSNAPDAPFLLDSLQNFLFQENFRHQVISHPILTVRRGGGRIIALDDTTGAGERESLIILEVEGVAAEERDAVVRGATKILEKTVQVQRDSHALGQRLQELEHPAERVACGDFWQWLRQGNFLPFAYRCLGLRKEEGGAFQIREIDGTALGLPFESEEFSGKRELPLKVFPPALQARIARSGPLVVEETDRRSPLHRSDPLVYLALRETVAEGWREHAFLGLFSRQGLDEPASNVPTLRRRIEDALAALGIPRDCHDYRKTIEIFDTFPKVELFFLTADELQEIVRSFTFLYRHGAVKVVPSRGLAVHGLTLLIIMPRDFHDEAMIPRFERYLRRFFRAPAATTRIIHVSPDFVSLHVGLQPERRGLQQLDRLERALTRIARPWNLRLQLLFAGAFGEIEGNRRWRKYAESFSRGYRTLVHPRYALRDVCNIEMLLTDGEERFALWGPFGQEENYCLRFYSRRQSYLNELMPLLENLHLKVIEEVDFRLAIDAEPIYIKSFTIRGGDGALPLFPLRQPLLAALGALRRGEVENDYLHRLLLLTGLDWRQIDIFRGYRNYYFQLGAPHSKRRVAFALIHNPRVGLLLFRYFEARFRPEERWPDFARREEEGLSPIRLELASALEEVSDVNEDRILRAFFNLIDSTVRTSFFLRYGRPDYFFAFKISALGIIDMPAPRPLFEIFVHANGIEGIHLRGGKVARGGIRWSDRPDDFRTEILGLMKTQMSKNALIVPVGSKGGFIVKTPATTREEATTLAKAAYQVLMRGLLDLTDNRRESEVIRPPGVVAYDEPDPYLVVAADKGTAQFSDIANAISREYGFWLDDAFASGGSHGYDHKVLGITARGAWECVKRHFREMGQDIQQEPFTVIGIGDMSGDVFGNGMLLSRHIRLLAAFDHRHIFLDPDPDPDISFRERQRLFELPRSSWDDYDRARISVGGGVWARQEKDIPLSEPVRQWLGVRHTTMDGAGLIRLLLAAETDLLWNGGIGTYVKATSEKQEEAGDRGNDAVRIDAGQLRAKVVGEGGNLGFTQKGRIEYALKGGRINTDAIDNSAGVDTSDHEVNLKILMRRLQEEGKVASGEERDSLLREVTDEVCAAVLADNYNQSLCLSLDSARSAADVEPYLALADRLSNAGLLDRRGESLPSAREVAARGGEGLTRPELAVLMAYGKMQLHQALLESDLPGRDGVRPYLDGYFPMPVRQRFATDLAQHPLAREIVATMIANIVVNQAGSAFIADLSQKTGVSLVGITATYLTFDQALDAGDIRRQISALDNRITAERQYAILLMLEHTLAGLCRWQAERGMVKEPEERIIEGLRQQTAAYLKTLGSILEGDVWQRCQQTAREMEGEGFSSVLAQRIATLPFLDDLLPLIDLVSRTGTDFHSMADTFNEIRRSFFLRQIEQRLREVKIKDNWDRLTLHSLQRRFASALSGLTLATWEEAEGNLEIFFARRRGKVKIFRTLEAALRSDLPDNYHPFAVLADALEEILS